MYILRSREPHVQFTHKFVSMYSNHKHQHSHPHTYICIYHDKHTYMYTNVNIYASISEVIPSFDIKLKTLDKNLRC